MPDELRRTIGRYRLFERKERMPGQKKYFVTSDDCTVEFNKYGKGVRWIKDRRKKEQSVLTA